jgi:hypothetical protein
VADAPQVDWSNRAIRWTTTLCVLLLAAIAAAISYRHMYLLVRRHGETSWAAALLPLSVDGMIAVASMSLLSDSRQGRRSGVLPWALLILGSAASLAANVAVAEPSLVGRLIAAWPSCALIGAYELLMRQIRKTAVKRDMSPCVGSDAHRRRPFGGAAAVQRVSEHSLRSRAGRAAPSDESLRATVPRGKDAEKTLADPALAPGSPSESIRRSEASDGVRDRKTSSRTDRVGDMDLQRRAWQWTVAHRTPKGDLPPGRAIGSQFGRSERWGRLIKQAGRAGRLDTVASG